LKRPWRDGTAAFLFTPGELPERLVAQVLRPRAHLTRYHCISKLAPARDAAGAVDRVLAVCHDITERKRAEDSLREEDRRKELFLATLAHELRNLWLPPSTSRATPGARGATEEWGACPLVPRRCRDKNVGPDPGEPITQVTESRIVAIT